MKKFLPKYLFIFIFLTTSCADNAFREISSSNQNTDEALYEDARKALNSGDYTTAITKIKAMTGAAQRQTYAKNTLASAYAGRCGLDLVSLATSLGSASSASLFGLMMNLVKDIDVSPLDCTRAQKLIESFGGSSVRSSDQNIFMAFLGFVKVGAFLKRKGDTNGDGVQDSVSVICDNTKFTSAGTVNSEGFIESDMENIITGFGLILDNSAAITSTLSGASVTASLDSITESCRVYQAASGVASCVATPISAACRAICAVTDESAISSTVVTMFRKMIDNQSLGIGTCADNNLITCCP